MITLLLNGSEIVAASAEVQAIAGGYQTPDGIYPLSAGIDGTATVGALPTDFAINRYQWNGSALVRLPDPPPSQAAIDAVTEARRAAYAAESDHLAIAWQAAVATDAADEDARKAAWLAARAAVQARLPYPT